MGLMEPEQFAATRVKTERGHLIELPHQEPVENTSQHGHLTYQQSSKDVALSLVNEILDESIEIFNKVDETNVKNNNGESSQVDCDFDVNVLNQLLGNDCDSNDNVSNELIGKTDYICTVSNYVDCLSEIEMHNKTSLPDSPSNCKSVDEGKIFINESIVNRVISSSSDDESESPLVSESDSSCSKSNENIPSHFSNMYTDKTNNMSSSTLKDFKSDKDYNEVLIVQNSTDISSQHLSCNVSSGTSPNMSNDVPVSSLVPEIEKLEMAPPDTVEPGKYVFQLESQLDDVLQVTEEHDCLSHPQVLLLQKQYDELHQLVPLYKEKAHRLDDCLADLEKLLDKVGLLEKKICQQEMELELAKQEKEIESRALISLRAESTTKFEAVKKEFEQANKEKEMMVMRYAKSEKELLDMKKEKAALLKQIKDEQKEKDNVLSKLRQISDDKSRLALALDNKNMELSTSHKEIDRLKEDINSRDIKIKWIQNKLLGEMDLHKECPDKIEKLNGQILELEKKLDASKEDIENYKKTIQELEPIKVLESQVREEQAKLIVERHDQSERVIKLKALQLKTDALIEENNNLSLQVENLEVERSNLEKKLSESRKESQELSNKLADCSSKLVEFDSISNQLTQERERLDKVNEEVEELRRSNEELLCEMSTCRSREAEMLSFTQKLTTKNVQLQSEFSNIESRAGELMLEAEKAESLSDRLKREVKEMKEQLELERSKREEERNVLAREVAEGRNKVSLLESQLSETKSNLHSSTNKHQALIRELQRELQSCHRRLEQEGKSGQNSSNQTDCRSNAGSSPNQSSTGRSSLGASSSLTSSLNSIPDATIVQPSHFQLEVSPSILVERILKLQTDSKNYQDKIEFLEDHNTTLVEELKKKGRLLHSYILREQAGALASQASDNHKLEVSKHGGIMASVYGSRPSDEGMTLELSLQINHKLQAILEDTLLKNITLKENIDTLGDEIERLKKLHPS